LILYKKGHLNRVFLRVAMNGIAGHFDYAQCPHPVWSLFQNMFFLIIPLGMEMIYENGVLHRDKRSPT